MTEPAQPPSEQPPPPEEDESSLVPALLAIYALYLLWRGAYSGFRGSVTTVRRALDLDRMIGGALAGVAQRALDRQREQAGRAGDGLWEHAPAAVRDAVETGLDVLAEALLWTDQHVHGDPATADSGDADPGEATVPTGEDPPDLLARMLSTAVSNAATLAAADLAGWSRKVWNTRGDDRVRDTHQLLRAQTRPISEPFVVRGHKLRFPGDPAAPIELRANCRCWLTYTR